MSTETYEVDYDAEAVWFDGAWLGREDLAKKIKSMIEAGDYHVARPSSALERLESALASARVLAVRVGPELADALDQAASRAGRPSSALLRDALAYYLGGGQSAVPAGDNGGYTAEVITESVSGDEASGAVELTPKRKEEAVVLDEPGQALASPEVNKSWFGR
jgi:predicted transcriptional regulator